MLCNKCHLRQATVSMYININGSITNQYLCEHCANEMNSINVASNVFNNFLFNDNKTINTVKRCPRCHTSFEEFTNTSFLGCEDCYNTFANELAPYIAKVQGEIGYKGKKLNQISDNKVKEKSLREQLADAVREERYLDAQKIKEQIQREGKQYE